MMNGLKHEFQYLICVGFLKGDLNRTTVRCNTPIQGAGAAILKCALGNLWSKVKETGEDKVRIAAAVHDELILLVKRRYCRRVG